MPIVAFSGPQSLSATNRTSSAGANRLQEPTAGSNQAGPTSFHQTLGAMSKAHEARVRDAQSREDRQNNSGDDERAAHPHSKESPSAESKKPSKPEKAGRREKLDRSGKPDRSTPSGKTRRHAFQNEANEADAASPSADHENRKALDLPSSESGAGSADDKASDIAHPAADDQDAQPAVNPSDLAKAVASEASTSKASVTPKTLHPDAGDDSKRPTVTAVATRPDKPNEPTKRAEVKEADSALAKKATASDSADSDVPDPATPTEPDAAPAKPLAIGLGTKPAARPASRQGEQNSENSVKEEPANSATAASTAASVPPSLPPTDAFQKFSDHLDSESDRSGIDAAGPGRATDARLAEGAQSPNGPHAANKTKGIEAGEPPDVSPESRFAEVNHDKIVSGVRSELLPNGGTMKLRLDPPELGTMQVSLHMKDGVVTASFQTSNAEATRLVSHTLSDLRNMLESHGITVDKLHVQQAPREEGGGTSDQREGGRQASAFEQHDARREQQRKDMVQKLWDKLAGKGPLDLVA